MTNIFSPRDRSPTDAEILSFWQMMFATDQTEWDYEDNAHLAHKPDAEVIHFVRNTILTRETNHGFWAREDGQIVGMAGLNLSTDPSKTHCAELGFSVRRAYRRRGIGYQLVTAALDKARALNRARKLGLQRIECSCFANNIPSIALLEKAGFRQEGYRTGAILKHGQLRDIREFGLVL